MTSRIRFLLFTECVWAFVGCSSPYSALQKVTGDRQCIFQFRPRVTTNYYRANVGILNHSLSGTLIMKAMPDSSTRLVFTSGPDVKLFDFAFTPEGGFRVLYIMEELNKKAVIKTLRKDFELILLMHTDTAGAYILDGGDRRYFAFPQEKGVNYYITDTSCTQLFGMERASNRKLIVEGTMLNDGMGTPDSIAIAHRNWHFTIGLKKILPDAEK